MRWESGPDAMLSRMVALMAAMFGRARGRDLLVLNCIGEFELTRLEASQLLAQGFDRCVGAGEKVGHRPVDQHLVLKREKAHRRRVPARGSCAVLPGDQLVCAHVTYL